MKVQNTASDRFWTIPNILSVFRVILIIPIINQLKINTQESNFAAFILIGVAYLTDFLDGLIARAFKSTSKVGQILDPVGDKLLAITVSAVLYIGKKAPFYFFILILLRDFVFSLGVFYALNTKKVIMTPMLIGKITTFILGIVLVLYPLRYSNLMQNHFFSMIINPAVVYGTYLVSLLLVISGIFYTVNYINNFLNQKKSQTGN